MIWNESCREIDSPQFKFWSFSLNCKLFLVGLRILTLIFEIFADDSFFAIYMLFWGVHFERVFWSAFRRNIRPRLLGLELLPKQTLRLALLKDKLLVGNKKSSGNQKIGFRIQGFHYLRSRSVAGLLVYKPKESSKSKVLKPSIHSFTQMHSKPFNPCEEYCWSDLSLWFWKELMWFI